jgi:hypothetical protein
VARQLGFSGQRVAEVAGLSASYVATKIMLGFDRGGAYAQVFKHCREQQVHWVTYRRAPLAVPAGLPVLTTITVNGKTRQVAWPRRPPG